MLTRDDADGMRLAGIVENLIEHGYVTPVGGEDATHSADMVRTWSAHNWRAAAHYYLQTDGYEFEQYEPDGTSAEDFERMRSYNEIEPDTDRAKPSPRESRTVYELPEINAELAPQDAVRALQDAAPRGALGRASLLSLLTLIARPVGVAWTPFEGAAPVYRKTSPSGGSRHPTEIYAYPLDVDGIDEGWYHVGGVDGVMSSFTTSIPIDTCLAASQFASSDRPFVLIIFTSIFRRNRYRYREPRTFRTVHMDVGHLMTTTEFVAKAFGFRAYPSTHVDSPTIARALNMDLLIEAPISSILITGT